MSATIDRNTVTKVNVHAYQVDRHDFVWFSLKTISKCQCHVSILFNCL